MKRWSRRSFLADVGNGMLLAGVGGALASRLGLSLAMAEDGEDVLDFGRYERLAALMQETKPQQLQPLLVAELEAGADLGTLVAAGALANARTFGGQDYIGFHAFMALMPAYEM
ncbi:MAG: hypothetical protein ACYTG6_04160 [Planctomycetota bacterium]|jgi:hypothetical protein